LTNPQFSDINLEKESALMIDKAALFTGLTKRNALRKAAGLPLLNLRDELAHEVALAVENEFTAFAEEHGDERLMIREQVMADLREQHGADFGHTMGGRWAINHETNKRFREHLLHVYGLQTPPLASKHAVIYGEGATAMLVEEDDEPA
jgi:hypothetical protein